MNVQDEIFIENQVKLDVMPAVKKAIPGILGFLLKLILPALEELLIQKIKSITDKVLRGDTNA